MEYKSDIEIAQACEMEPITAVAQRAGVDEAYLEQYGRYKAKVDYKLLKDKADAPDGKLILVTAITPTPAGEGKTTTTIGLGDALRRIGKNVVIALREPSLGPVFGIKGGAAGGGYAQVVPMEDINLHFTGDFHAIGAANNLLAAMLDNHIQQGNVLGIDPRRITWRRAVDMNDRQLRNIVSGLGGKANGVPREDGFDITVASEIMAVLCLAGDVMDLKAKLARIIVGYTYDGKPVTAGDLKAQGAMAALLKDALKPNLVQTLEGTPAFVHGGPFANIAHGCNSVTATKVARKLGDYCVTEAGFGADLGAEKFLDIKCRMAGLRPDAVVVVATVRALKYHGGVEKADLGQENLAALEAGMPNLLQHVENITTVYGLPCVVAINRFPTDSEAELELVREKQGRRRRRRARKRGRAPVREGKRLPLQLHGRHVHPREARGRGDEGLSRRRRGSRGERRQAAAGARGARLRLAPGLHCQDAVLLLGRSDQALRPARLPRGGAQPQGERGRGLHRGADGRYHDDARSAEGARRREDRRGRQW